jgi:hypothetical protein
MSESAAARSKEEDLANLKEKVLREILPTFRASASPKISDDEVQAGVELLFELLAHRIGDDELDAIGEQIVTGLRRWFDDAELVKLADRYEPFCKFVLKVIDPAKFGQLQAESGNRLSAAKVLKALPLVNNRALSVFESCAWEQFPPAGVVRQPDFLEHVARIYVFRNVDDHQARVLNQRQKAEIAESVCVFLVWCVIRFGSAIRRVLTTAKFTDHLKNVRQRFEEVGTRFEELTTEARSAAEYRFLDPLAPSPEAASSSEQTDASKLADVNRVTVIEAEPGAGKTWTLQFLAWQQASRLLDGKARFHQVPVYVELKLLPHPGQTIEAAVEQSLKPASGEARPIPWNSLLLLVDGVNEVTTQHQTNIKAELRDLLSRFTKLRVVLTGRPNSFRGEFEAHIVVLQRLSDEQLSNLFRCALGDAGRAAELLDAVRHSSFLSSWARTPLHAAMVVGLAKQGGIDALADHSTTVRRFVRRFLNREVIQAPGQTPLLTKERLLARLAFETKDAGHLTFSKVDALSALGKAKAQVAATSLDVPKFIQEVLDNRLLQQADAEAMEFAHELYHDYFTAAELETREQMQTGLGTTFALAHFSEGHWNECLRLFAGFSNSSRTLVERGAEKNPFLAWQLLRDAGDETPELIERVSGEAYCTLSAELKSAAQATMAGACIYVLADLGRADLLEQAIAEQRPLFEPKGQGKLTDEQKAVAQEKQKQVVVPLGNGLLLLVRLGMIEQRSGQEGRFCQAARSAIRGLERIKAARVLCAMLSAWTSSTFSEPALIPGTVLDALINLGVDEVLNREDKSMNETLATWLKRASEAGFSKAWPAYGRVLRLARRVYVADTGLEFDGESALKWLRQSHEAGDSKSTLELALLLVEEPEFANEAGQGEGMLRQLAQTNLEARYELGLRLLKGENLPKSEAEGFERLLSAAESGHTAALSDVNPLLCGEFVVGPPPHIVLPPWAKSHQGRLKVLFQNNRLELR